MNDFLKLLNNSFYGKVMEEMKSAGVTPNLGHWNSLIHDNCSPQELRELVDEMREANLKPDGECLLFLVNSPDIQHICNHVINTSFYQ